MNENDNITYVDKQQIDEIFKKNSEKSDPLADENAAAYPEECCDASEISDDEYAHWTRRCENGFWNTFLSE